jgi:hypothetical protein
MGATEIGAEHVSALHGNVSVTLFSHLGNIGTVMDRF